MDNFVLSDGQKTNPIQSQFAGSFSSMIFGIERCEICGQEVNMGGVEIVNPNPGMSYTDPDDPLEGESPPELTVHYMEHRSFNYEGNVHEKSRIDLARSVKILEIPCRCGDLGIIYWPADLNRECKVTPLLLPAYKNMIHSIIFKVQLLLFISKQNR